ncbi:hypothetical protein BDY19DRAFT_1020162 [Irpex rosettiformis]|uniref:Uncharacterized protein n=1 Tax=Irpex rosettiformis TaxID=378272 RepID=A0ACB8UGF7_9APHY|nr:hypothetical protein BDY19DRAFT_1020162 [Irpex rosettiformis]
MNGHGWRTVNVAPSNTPAINPSSVQILVVLPELTFHFLRRLLSSANRSSPGLFSGRPPPPIVLDDNQRTPTHPTLAPMDIDRPPVLRESSSFTRDGPRGGPPSSLVLKPAPSSQQLPVHPHEPFSRALRPPSISQSPPPHNRFPSFNERPPPVSGPASHVHSHSHSRSPRMYSRAALPADRDPRDLAWDRRATPSEREQRERYREREQQLLAASRTNGEYPPPQPSQQVPYYPRPHLPSVYPARHHRDLSRGLPRERESPTDTEPRIAHPAYQTSRVQSTGINSLRVRRHLRLSRVNDRLR